MSEERKKCMICGKMMGFIKGSICEPCQDRIRREAMGEQAGVSQRADRELSRQGVTSTKK